MTMRDRPPWFASQRLELLERLATLVAKPDRFARRRSERTLLLGVRRFAVRTAHTRRPPQGDELAPFLNRAWRCDAIRLELRPGFGRDPVCGPRRRVCRQNPHRAEPA